MKTFIRIISTIVAAWLLISFGFGLYAFLETRSFGAAFGMFCFWWFMVAFQIWGKP